MPHLYKLVFLGLKGLWKSSSSKELQAAASISGLLTIYLIHICKQQNRLESNVKV